MPVYAYKTGTVDTTATAKVNQGDQLVSYMVLKNETAVTQNITGYNKNTVFTNKAITTTGNDTSRRVPPGTASIGVAVSSSAASGTTPSVTVKVDWSVDGTNWGSTDSFTAITTAGASQYQVLTVKGTYYRISWTVSGTTPSVTVTVTANPIPQPDI